MRKRYLLVVPPRFLAALVSASVSFLGGLIIPLEVSSNLTNFLVSTVPIPKFRSENQANYSSVLAGEINQGFGAVINNLQVDQKQELNKLGSVPSQFQGKTIEKVNLKNNAKVIALTFDDGPWPETTNNILYVLKKYNIKATFFMLGRNVKNYPEEAAKIALEGHAIGNHSWSHPYHYHTPAAAAKQIDTTANIIYQTTGVKTQLFRPPGGYLNNGLVAYAYQKKYANIMWSADSQDYRSSKQTMLKNLFNQEESGGIILMHDGGGNRWHTLVALPYLIEELQQKGYQFVTIPELLQMSVE